MKILISSCLLGDNVKYSGGNNFSLELDKLLKKYNVTLIKVCPEVMGGLSTPRLPAEIKENDIITTEGVSVLEEFKTGATFVLNEALSNKIDFAILKERSPSCGSKTIYDGTFSKKMIAGQGLTTQFLVNNGIKVFSEEDLKEIEKHLKNQ